MHPAATDPPFHSQESNRSTSEVRLTKLKLAGFKSFVDPTTVLLPGQLVGVAGPNGCGKSNIIDAVRWVLGESKAAALRGDSMQDVIFNGSTGRKPVGRASVELVFDNASGRAAGQWSQYSEIAVKRVLERNGESAYYINGVHVRRRDVIDVFLGTGLGPRAYAIIEQGTISRIIEAKPEDLRVFLEEAAGVTKYKERRRETESRLSDARDNLARVGDICSELEAQIVKLEGQAELAQRYRGLQAQLAERQNLLWLLKRNDARNERERAAREVERATNRLEAETASLRELERLAEEVRSAHYAAADGLHAAQTEMFAANADVARLESELQHWREARSRLDARLSQLGIEWEHWQSELEHVDADQQRWQDLLDGARSRVAQSQARHEAAAGRLPQAEAALREAEGAANALARELAQVEQQLRVEETERANALRSLEAVAQRRQRLEQDRQALMAPDAHASERLRATLDGLRQAAASHQAELAALQSQLPQREQAQRAAVERERQAQKQLTEARARRDALLQLQSRVQQNGKLGDWLKRHGLDGAAPLWRAIEVEPGWEMALEAVLRERLGAVALDDDTGVGALLRDPAPVNAVVAVPALADAPPVLGADSAACLAGKVRCGDARWQSALAQWLRGVFVAEDLAALVSRRNELAAGECWVDRSGQTLSRTGVSFYVADERTHGVIARQREIGELESRLKEFESELAGARGALQEEEAALAREREALNGARRTAQELQQRLHAAQVEGLKLNQAQQRYDERCGQIQRDLTEVTQSEAVERERHSRADGELARQRELARVLRSKLEAALAAQRASDGALAEARTAEAAMAREEQEARFSERECAGKLGDIARLREVAQEQIERIRAETATAGEERALIDESGVEAELQTVLESRRGREERLAASRQAVEDIAAELRRIEESRLNTEQGLGPLRDRIGDLRLRQQAAQLNEDQCLTRLTEAGADEATLAPKLTRELKESMLVGELGRLNQELTELGAVNLAALEELTAARSRKGFLDAQAADLNQAISTLEDAIRRIDRETRNQLRATYDLVNQHFGTLFPELFGGGEARLVLTGEEILDSGVHVIAQPPGKKNASIHLLSGGEKALAAIALVFSFFQLNPAPFCLLDEVDAPLDDSNTERFCDMVKRMSQQTQFLFISHNKITMEMAQQLIGVTMQEQGVSHVVEVDIEEALRLREEAAA